MNIYLCVGMVGSGKSTYARRRAEEGSLIVCHDDLCAMLHARSLDGCGYDPGLRETYRRIEEDIVKRALAAGRDVVIDRTNLTRESRERWVKFGARWHFIGNNYLPDRVHVIAVVFPIVDASIHAERRFRADPRGRSYDEWLGVALHHEQQAKAEPVSEDKGFHEVRYEPGGPTP